MENHYKLIVIGSGPAGLTAAIYGARAELEPLVIGGTKYGGQLMLTTLVENYPGFKDGIMGPELMMNMIKQAERFGAKMVFKDATKVDLSKAPYKVFVNEDVYTCDTLIIATGAEARWLDLPNEKALIGRGLSTCATCDAAFYRNKKVAVIGGGDSAMEEAHFLTKFATEVTLIHRRDEFRASKAMQTKVLENPKVKVLYNTEIKGYVANEEIKEGAPSNTLRLKALKLFNNKENKESELELDGLFIAVGHTPKTDIFKGQLEIDQKGYLKGLDGSTLSAKTNKEGVFICGDVEDYRYRQAIVAAGAGCSAAMEAESFLNGIKDEKLLVG